MDAEARLLNALNDVIGNQSKTYQAVVTAINGNGRVQAFSEVFGNIVVICRTSDKIDVGTAIFIRKSGPKKYDPFIYAGYGQSPGGSTSPAIDAPVYVAPPVDDGGTTEEGGTLQYYLDQITSAIRAIKGTGAWNNAVDQTLTQAVNWRAPVVLVTDLPASNNRIGDIRFVTVDRGLYVWTASGWQSMSLSNVAGNVMEFSTSPAGIASFLLVANVAAGIVPADATNSDHIDCVVGITTESAGSGNPVIVQLDGIVRFTGSPFTTRDIMYVGAGGALSATPPPLARFVQQAGRIVSSNEFHLNLKQAIEV